MKFKIANIFITIEKRYKSVKKIMPIGCDCHPAYMVNFLGLRKVSLPFDWLDTQPILALQYAYENIQNNFSFFLSDLAINPDLKVYSARYDYSLFYHYDDLIENKQLQEKLRRRTLKFLDFYKYKKCYFLHNITSSCLKNKADVDFYLTSIYNFKSILKQKDSLNIYLRYDENLEENKEFCEMLLREASKIKNIIIVQYIREKDEFGIWGNERQYKYLIKQLGINVYLSFPKFNIQIKKLKC